MEIKVNEITVSEHEVEVTLQYEEIKPEIEEAYRKERKKISLPGFRKGKIPMPMLKKMYGEEVCLIGNVNCGLLESGTDEEVTAAVRYALQNGMPDFGYIFSTSNCVYTGMPLERYELMMKIWREEGNYPDIIQHGETENE